MGIFCSLRQLAVGSFFDFLAPVENVQGEEVVRRLFVKPYVRGWDELSAELAEKGDEVNILRREGHS